MKSNTIVQVGPTTWIALSNLDTVDWSAAKRCPIVFTRSGRRAYATDYTLPDDTPDTPASRAWAMANLLRSLTAAIPA